MVEAAGYTREIQVTHQEAGVIAEFFVRKEGVYFIAIEECMKSTKGVCHCAHEERFVTGDPCFRNPGSWFQL